MAITNIADRAGGYGMPGQVVDGQDVVAVYRASQEAVQRARRGEGPTLLECKTYRFRPHYPIFAEDRPDEEIQKWLARDPITILGLQLKKQGHLDEAAMAAMEQAILQELADALAEAEAAAMPDPQEVFANLYAEDPPAAEP
jgi:pyruvate dehydrogenase E1 component alpha subunit